MGGVLFVRGRFQRKVEKRRTPKLRIVVRNVTAHSCVKGHVLRCTIQALITIVHISSVDQLLLVVFFCVLCRKCL